MIITPITTLLADTTENKPDSVAVLLTEETKAQIATEVSLANHVQVKDVELDDHENAETSSKVTHRKRRAFKSTESVDKHVGQGMFKKIYGSLFLSLYSL